MKTIFFILLLIFLGSCDKSNPFEKILALDFNKGYYWNQQIITDTGYVKSISNFEFNIDGTVNYYIGSPNSYAKGVLVFDICGNPNDLNESAKTERDWVYSEKDSLFTIRMSTYKILKYSKDTILIKSKNEGKRSLLIKVKE